MRLFSTNLKSQTSMSNITVWLGLSSVYVRLLHSLLYSSYLASTPLTVNYIAVPLFFLAQYAECQMQIPLTDLQSANSHYPAKDGMTMLCPLLPSTTYTHNSYTNYMHLTQAADGRTLLNFTLRAGGLNTYILMQRRDRPLSSWTSLYYKLGYHTIFGLRLETLGYGVRPHSEQRSSLAPTFYKQTRQSTTSLMLILPVLCVKHHPKLFPTSFLNAPLWTTHDHPSLTKSHKFYSPST